MSQVKWMRMGIPRMAPRMIEPRNILALLPVHSQHVAQGSSGAPEMIPEDQKRNGAYTSQSQDQDRTTPNHRPMRHPPPRYNCRRNRTGSTRYLKSFRPSR